MLIGQYQISSLGLVSTCAPSIHGVKPREIPGTLITCYHPRTIYYRVELYEGARR